MLIQQFITEFDLGYKVSTMRIRTLTKLMTTENCCDSPLHQFTFHHTLRINPKNPTTCLHLSSPLQTWWKTQTGSVPNDGVDRLLESQASGTRVLFKQGFLSSESRTRALENCRDTTFVLWSGTLQIFYHLSLRDIKQHLVALSSPLGFEKCYDKNKNLVPRTCLTSDILQDDKKWCRNWQKCFWVQLRGSFEHCLV